MSKCITFDVNEWNKEKFYPVKGNRGCNKPLSGGFWTSTLLPATENYSAWANWCIQEEFCLEKLNHAIIFDLSPKAKIYTINTYKDLEELIERYPFTLPFYNGIDFEAVSRDYDAIHLTDEGQWATRDTYPYDLYGWDVESYLIMNLDCVINPVKANLPENWWKTEVETECI